MRVMVYSPLSFRFGGGFETSLMEIIRRLRPMGITFSVVTSDYTGNGSGECPPYVQAFLEKHECDVIELKSRPFFLGSPPSPILGIKSYRDLRRAVIRSDLVYFNNAYAFHDVMMTLVRKTVRRPIISSYHAVLFCGSRLHDNYVGVVSRRLARGFQAHHVLNKEDYKRVEEWGAKKVFLIPIGVDTKKFKPPADMKKNDRMRMLFVGRLTWQKGVDIVCNLIRKVNGQDELRRSVEFVIVGTGPMKGLVEEVSKKYENVVYRGTLDSQSLCDTYASSDIFVMPSRYETFGIVALEAQSSGVPVIATDTTGPKDIIIPSKTGSLIAKPDTDMFYESIQVFFRAWLDDFSHFIRMREDCRANALAGFDWDTIAIRFASMLNEVASLN